MPETAIAERQPVEAPVSSLVETPPKTEPTEVERIARAMGYKTREEFQGDPLKYTDITPEEWILNSQKINKHLKSEVKDLKRTLGQTKEHISRVEKAAIERTIRDMTAARDQAIEAGDVGRVRQFDEAIDTQKAHIQQVVNQPPELEPDLREWADNNKWFFDDPELKAYALAVQNKLLATGEKLDNSTMLARVTSRVKEKFPEHFPASNAQAASKVEGTVASGGGASRSSSKGHSFRDLGPVEQEVCLNFEKRGTMTREEYVDDMKKIGYFDGHK